MGYSATPLGHLDVAPRPLFSSDKKLVLAANGEIYNHSDLRKEFVGSYDFSTNSDCEVIIALYKKYGSSFLDKMNGIFGFAIYDAENDEYFIARDHIGIIPLYIGWDEKGTFYVASELKALEGKCQKIQLFPHVQVKIEQIWRPEVKI